MSEVLHNLVQAEETDIAAVADVVRSGQWAMGPLTVKFEKNLAEVCQREYCVMVASGISALRLSLIATGIQTGDYVGVPAYSCVALANAVLSLGAIPVPLDCDPNTLNVDPDSLLAKANKLCCAIIVNTFGLPADFKRLRKAGIPLIEDCAHGFGHAGLGQNGDVAVISLYATKFLGCGRGGAILTDNGDIAEHLRGIRDYDDKPASGLVLNDKPDDLNAALAFERLKRLQDIISRREKLAGRYNASFSSLKNEKIMTLPTNNRERIWYRYTVNCDNAPLWVKLLEQFNIKSAIPVTDWLDYDQHEDCINATRAYQNILSIPLYPALSEKEQDFVIDSIYKINGSRA